MFRAYRMSMTRKRKRLGSPSVRIPSLKKFRAKSRAPPPAESVELLIRLSAIGVLKTYVVKIDSADLKMFSEVDSSYDHWHDHSNGDPGRFCGLKTYPSFLSALPDGCPKCYVALLGSTIYSVFYRAVAGARLEFKSIHLNENPDLSEDEKWATLPPPPCEVDPFWSTVARCHPKLFSLRGRLYFVGALRPVALVFDPATATWSKLDGPPGLNLNPSFQASLGEEHGKLLFYHTNYTELPPYDCSICIYDVVTGTWDVHPDTPFRDHHLVSDNLILGNALVNRQEPNTIYWLNKNLGKVFAFDWKNMRISSGPIIGMDHEYLLDMLKHGDTSFCHVWGQIFCFFWSVIFSDHTPPFTADTHLHLTFLRVVNNDAFFLTAFVVGCHELILPGSYRAYEASLLR